MNDLRTIPSTDTPALYCATAGGQSWFVSAGESGGFVVTHVNLLTEPVEIVHQVERKDLVTAIKDANRYAAWELLTCTEFGTSLAPNVAEPICLALDVDVADWRACVRAVACHPAD